MTNQRSKMWLKIGCLCCAVLPCLLGIGTFMYIKMRVGSQAAKLPVEIDKLKKMGIPTESADLEPKPPIPDSENAVFVYDKIFDAFKAIKEDKANNDLSRALSAYGSNLQKPGDDKLAQEAIAKFSKVFALGDSLLTKPAYYKKRDYTQGFALLFPEYAQMKQLVKWETARARFQMDSGDLEGALKSLRVAYQVADHLGSEVTLIGGLVCMAVQAIDFYALDSFLQKVKDNPAMLAKARKMLEGLHLNVDLRRLFSGELVMGRYGVRVIRSLADLGVMSGETSMPSEAERLLSKLMADESFRKMIEYKFVEKWREAFERLPADGRDWRQVNQVMAGISKEIEADKSIEGKVNQIIFPVFDQVGTALGEMQARTRLSLLAVRLLQDRRNGLPKDLSRYGELGIDPMDGNPMRYRVSGKGFEIWSIGRDLVDDGGMKYVPGTGMKNEHTDIVLRYDYGQH